MKLTTRGALASNARRSASAALAVTGAVLLMSGAHAQVAGSPQPEPTDTARAAEVPFTLAEALTAATANSPSVAAGNADLRAAEAWRNASGLRPNPVLQLDVENVAGTRPYNGVKSAEVTSSFALPIELGGKRARRVELADAQVERAMIGTMIAAADLSFLVTQAYIATIAAERRVEITRMEADFAAAGFRSASARVNAGAASPIEQQRADVLQINANVAFENARRDAMTLRDNFGRLIGRSINYPLDRVWFERIEGFGPQAPVSAEGTLALAAAEQELLVASAQVRLARSQRVPDITLSAGARRLAASGDTAAVFGVSIPLPLFNRGTAGVDQAIAQESAALSRQRLALIEAEQEIAAAQSDVANAAELSRASGGPALDAALEAARIAAIGYAHGKFSQLELIDAQRMLAQARTAHLDALTAYHLAKARLARLTTPAALQANAR